MFKDFDSPSNVKNAHAQLRICVPIRTYPPMTVSAQDASNQPCRLLDDSLLYSA